MRATLLVAMSMLGSLMVASGMILSEVTNSHAALMRVLIAAITGLILAPMVIATMWRKPLMLAVVPIFLPPAVAGLICLWEFEPDYGYFKLAVPLIFVCCLVTAIVLPQTAREHDPNKCQACGYDLRGSPSLRCPECGSNRSQFLQRSPTPLTRAIDALTWLAMAAFSGAIVSRFFAWLMSLG